MLWNQNNARIGTDFSEGRHTVIKVGYNLSIFSLDPSVLGLELC